MSKPDAMRILLDSFQSCKHEDRSLAVFEAEQIAARVERVLALHHEEVWEDLLGGKPAHTGQCQECGQPWPCETRLYLDGEER